MSTLEERFEASHRIRARLGRVGPDGKSLPLEPHHWVAPDLERIIGEAAFGLVWNREETLHRASLHCHYRRPHRLGPGASTQGLH